MRRPVLIWRPALVAWTCGDERRALARGAHIVVATPGRLRDHIMRGSIDLTAIRAVVLDEADEMLDLGFREDLEFILEENPSRSPNTVCSLPPSHARSPIWRRSISATQRGVSTVSEQTQHADIELPRDDGCPAGWWKMRSSTCCDTTRHPMPSSFAIHVQWCRV